MSVSYEKKEKYSIDDLLRIMEILRSEEGCPWDREQTHPSMRRDMIEEAYEVCEAIDLNDTDLLKEELGDVLLQVVHHARIEQEQGSFDFQDVCDGICRKLIQRHPHVFADVQVDGTEQVLNNWEQIKQQSKGQTTGAQTLLSVPKTFPALTCFGQWTTWKANWTNCRQPSTRKTRSSALRSWGMCCFPQ